MRYRRLLYVYLLYYLIVSRLNCFSTVRIRRRHHDGRGRLRRAVERYWRVLLLPRQQRSSFRQRTIHHRPDNGTNHVRRQRSDKRQLQQYLRTCASLRFVYTYQIKANLFAIHI